MNIRSFLAFDIPQDVRGKLARLIKDFAGKESGVKWIQPENLHVTLKFFGDVPEELLVGEVSKKIEDVAKAAKPVALECSGVGAFPNWKYPRVIWAGFAGDTEAAIGLQQKLEDALAEFNFKKDARAFRLHLTIGRAKELKSSGRLMRLVNELGPIDFGKVEINKLALYKSVLTKEGSVYTVLKNFELGR